MSDDLVKRLMNRRDYEGIALNPDGPEAVARILALGVELLHADARIEELEAKLAAVTSERDRAIQGEVPLDDKGVTWHELCERWKGCCLDALARIEELKGEKK